MNYKGNELILDNFREVLSKFSVDVQDVVRSAILDGIDIAGYINQCRSNPYRLDQIRLGKKEGIPDKFFEMTSGKALFRLRSMIKKGIRVPLDIDTVRGSSEEVLNYVLTWIEEGVPFERLNVSLIPTDLLEVFDFGLRQGYDMVEFNTGKKYAPEYIKSLLRLKSRRVSITPFLREDWKVEVVKELSYLAECNIKHWDNLMRNIDPQIDLERLLLILRYWDGGMPLKEIQQKDSNGGYIYDLQCIQIIYSAFLNKLDCKKLLKETSAEAMQELFNELEFDKRRKMHISGRLRKTHYSSSNKEE